MDKSWVLRFERAKTFNLNKVKITFPSSKFFELSKPPTYNSIR